MVLLKKIFWKYKNVRIIQFFDLQANIQRKTNHFIKKFHDIIYFTSDFVFCFSISAELPDAFSASADRFPLYNIGKNNSWKHFLLGFRRNRALDCIFASSERPSKESNKSRRSLGAFSAGWKSKWSPNLAIICEHFLANRSTMSCHSLGVFSAGSKSKWSPNLTHCLRVIPGESKSNQSRLLRVFSAGSKSKWGPDFVIVLKHLPPNRSPNLSHHCLDRQKSKSPSKWRR